MGVPGYFDAGDGQGVWNSSMAAAEHTRRRNAQATAAAAGLAATNARIAAIRADSSKTPAQKISALKQLVDSGYSREEYNVLRAAQETG